MPFKRSLLVLLLVLFLAISLVLAGSYEEGEIYHGFKLEEKRFVKEVNAECLYFNHLQSGARLFKIMSDDVNKTFCIAFKTIPESDAGTPHIMEHGVLNGSKNFPVKSPFDVLSKGSLKTFLNAMTGSDITLYPIASMNEKDYFNLMHVYLDAVFYPLIYQDPRILKQEGWHYELTDTSSLIAYRGIVYNEMKGAFSNPERELYYQAGKHLFPDTPYRYSSGGYPEAIPTLTYDQYLDFHRTYYHPSNSYILLYGDGDLDKELAFINDKYLSDFQKSDKSISIPLQPPFDSVKTVRAYYSVPQESNTEHQTYLSMNYVAGISGDRKLNFALDILTDVLVNQESAPIRLALQEAGIGREVSAAFDELKQYVVQIVVKNADPADRERFRKIIRKELQKVVDEGLDKEAVAATLNRLEFNLREDDTAQKGLNYFFKMYTGWFFDDNPYLNLEWEKPLAALKASIEDGYLERIVKKYLLNNDHALLLVVEPQPGREKELKDRTTRELAAYKASLSSVELQQLVRDTEDLIAYQQKEDSPEALATIPLLSLEDIDPAPQWFEIDTGKIARTPLLHFNTFTNDVMYVKFMYDLRVLPVDLIPYAALLAKVMGSLNTTNYSYGDLDKALKMHTGGFSTYLGSYLIDREDERLLPKYIVFCKAMETKIDKLFELVEEIVNETRYDDRDRLRDVLVRHHAQLEASVKSNGYGFAKKRALSYFTNRGMFSELTSGIEYYWFVSELIDNYDVEAAQIIEKLSETADLLFGRDNLIVTVTGASSALRSFSRELRGYVRAQPRLRNEYQTWHFELEPKNEGLMAASKVQYVIQGYDFKKLGYAWNGKIRVLDQILHRDWLYNQIRVIGGAYGGWSDFSSSGSVLFASYRDPNLEETLNTFWATPEYLQSFDADSTDMTRYIIGTISNIDNPHTPAQEGNLAVRYYFENISEEDLQKERDEILNTSVDDIKNMENMVTDFLKQKTICVYGNEEQLQNNPDLFKQLVKLIR